LVLKYWLEQVMVKGLVKVYALALVLVWMLELMCISEKLV